MKIFFSLGLISIFFFCAKAQEECMPKTLRAVIPHYPVAAIALNANGQVKVEIKVNNEGTTISAVAEGSKWLREISENVSKEWEFSKLSEKYVKKCGVRKATLIFNYILLPIGTSQNKESWSFVSLPYTVVIKKVKPEITTGKSDSP